jgi:hypothetical protein
LLKPGEFTSCEWKPTWGYDLELRIRRPAPFTNVREAVRMEMYDHIAQVVDAAVEPSPR